MNLKGKRALITGSSRGIGQQIAIDLARRGVHVVLHGQDVSNTEATKKAIEPFGVEVHCVGAPLNSDDGARSLVAQVKSAVGHVDILYSNAAVQNPWKDIFELDADDWKRLFQINLFSVVTIHNGLIPDMVRNGYGRVIALTSGIPDIPELSPYGASKWAINKYVFDMAAKLKGTGVTIHAMDPGWLRTDLGGPQAEHPVEAVLPGAVIPLITDNVIPSGSVFRAQDYRGL